MWSRLGIYSHTFILNKIIIIINTRILYNNETALLNSPGKESFEWTWRNQEFGIISSAPPDSRFRSCCLFQNQRLLQGWSGGKRRRGSHQVGTSWWRNWMEVKAARKRFQYKWFDISRVVDLELTRDIEDSRISIGTLPARLSIRVTLSGLPSRWAL